MIECINSLESPTGLYERLPFVVVCLGNRWIQFCGSVEGRDRLFIPLKIDKRYAVGVPCLRRLRVDLDRFLSRR
jgi:hypothetical protein